MSQKISVNSSKNAGQRLATVTSRAPVQQESQQFCGSDTQINLPVPDLDYGKVTSGLAPAADQAALDQWIESDGVPIDGIPG